MSSFYFCGQFSPSDSRALVDGLSSPISQPVGICNGTSGVHVGETARVGYTLVGVSGVNAIKSSLSLVFMQINFASKDLLGLD